jgi:SAM-dependent methyltransferase
MTTAPTEHFTVTDKRIPPPEINFNQNERSSLDSYVDVFRRDACIRLLPFLMNHAGLTPGGSILDYGCGLGRLAYAASHFLTQDGAYFGYEPNQDALRFLKSAYSDLSNFHFGGAQLTKTADYIAVKENRGNPEGIEATDVDIADLVNRSIDVQFSSSVFTHMWMEPIIGVLQQFTKLLSIQGTCVNTWLIIDDFAAYTLRCGVADRKLPFKINGAWTYLEENPLMCTAYELKDVEAVYAAAGHKIEAILWGSWSGRDNGTTYQDIVISRPS